MNESIEHITRVEHQGLSDAPFSQGQISFPCSNFISCSAYPLIYLSSASRLEALNIGRALNYNKGLEGGRAVDLKILIAIEF